MDINRIIIFYEDNVVKSPEYEVAKRMLTDALEDFYKFGGEISVQKVDAKSRASGDQETDQ